MDSPPPEPQHWVEVLIQGMTTQLHRCCLGGQLHHSESQEGCPAERSALDGRQVPRVTRNTAPCKHCILH